MKKFFLILIFVAVFVGGFYFYKAEAGEQIKAVCDNPTMGQTDFQCNWQLSRSFKFGEISVYFETIDNASGSNNITFGTAQVGSETYKNLKQFYAENPQFDNTSHATMNLVDLKPDTSYTLNFLVSDLTTNPPNGYTAGIVNFRTKQSSSYNFGATGVSKSFAGRITGTSNPNVTCNGLTGFGPITVAGRYAPGFPLFANLSARKYGSHNLSTGGTIIGVYGALDSVSCKIKIGNTKLAYPIYIIEKYAVGL